MKREMEDYGITTFSPLTEENRGNRENEMRRLREWRDREENSLNGEGIKEKREVRHGHKREREKGWMNNIQRQKKEGVMSCKKGRRREEK